MSWQEAELGNVIITKKGFAFKSSKYVTKGVPVVRVSDFTLNSISDNDLKYYPKAEKDTYISYVLHQKDILIQTVGSWQNNPNSVVGKVVRVPFFLEGSLLNQNIVKIETCEEVNHEFLYYRLKCDDFKGHVLGEARGAANQASITLDTIKSFKFQLPSLEEQHRISYILSTYDDLIENNQKQIKLLEEAAQRLYKEWFVDLRFPGYEDAESVDGVPNGWNKTNIGKCCALKKQVLKPQQIPQNIPYIGLEHMPRKDFCLSQWGNSNDVSSDKYKYSENDIIFGKIRPYFHKVGFTINKGISSTDTFIMIPEQGIWGLFLMTVSSKSFVDYTYQTCKEGAKMPRADWNQMKDYPILLASDEIQSEFEKQIKSITDKIKNHAIQIHKISEMRDRLLPKLMSREIEV